MEVREAEAEADGREAEAEMEALSWRELTFCSNALILSLSSFSRLGAMVAGG